MNLCFAGFTEWADCTLLWVSIVALFFLAAVFRRQVADNLLGIDFSLIGSAGAAEVIFLIMIFITHSLKWSFLLGLVGMLLAGFLTAPFMPDGSSEGGGGEGWY